MLVKNKIMNTDKRNYIYIILFKIYNDYFYNLKIILSILNNFNDEIINFIFFLFTD